MQLPYTWLVCALPCLLGSAGTEQQQQQDLFLMLSDTQIISLPSFTPVPCPSIQFPVELAEFQQTAGQVYNEAGQALLLVGGAEGRWWLREDGVWQQAADSQESWRSGAASSDDGQGGWLVSGGEGVASTEVWRRGCSGRGGWSSGPDLPFTVLVGGEVFLVGGYSYTSGTPVSPVTLKLSEGEWVEVSPLTKARQQAACAEHNGKLYVMGGYGGGGGYLTSTEIYDPAEDRWEPGPELLSPLTAAQAVSVAGELWLLRGHGSNSYNDKVWRLGETDWEETGLIVEGGDRQVFPAPLLTDQMLQCKNI